MGTPCNYVQKVHHENANVEYKRAMAMHNQKIFDEKINVVKKTPWKIRTLNPIVVWWTMTLNVIVTFLYYLKSLNPNGWGTTTMSNWILWNIECLTFSLGGKEKYINIVK